MSVVLLKMVLPPTNDDSEAHVQEEDVAPSVNLLESMRSSGTPSKPQLQTWLTTAFQQGRIALILTWSLRKRAHCDH